MENRKSGGVAFAVDGFGKSNSNKSSTIGGSTSITSARANTPLKPKSNHSQSRYDLIYLNVNLY